jgi:Holliday junction resolvase RusA-like endonuclease
LNDDPLVLFEQPKLVIIVPGKAVSGNHKTGQKAIARLVTDPNTGQTRSKWGVINFTKKEALEYTKRIQSLARYAALQCRWVRPEYVRVDISLVCLSLDRDNGVKLAMDALQGIAYKNDSRVLDGGIQKRKDNKGARIEIVVRPVDPKNYGYP